MSSQVQSYPLRKAGAFSVGLLLGGLIGSATMLLLAPQTGKKTREQLADDSIELRDQVSQTVQDTVKLARGTAHKIGSAVRKQTKELGQRGQDALDEQKEIASDLVAAEKTAVRKQTKELGQRGHDALDEQKEIASDLVAAEKTAVRHLAAD